METSDQVKFTPPREPSLRIEERRSIAFSCLWACGLRDRVVVGVRWGGELVVENMGAGWGKVDPRLDKMLFLPALGSEGHF